MPEPFASRIDDYRERIAAVLDGCLPAAAESPRRLHEAMRYAVESGGKRIRPLLVYASAECLGVEAQQVDAGAAAIELIHAFSLVHDDLPAMDDDDLRRGQPTVHRRFDEATAILAGDALLPLAFGSIADAGGLSTRQRVELISLIASASGSRGMTGGQAMDLAAERTSLTAIQLENLHSMKTGALIHAAVMTPACVAEGLGADSRAHLDQYARNVGLAFQIRDDVLDVEGETAVLGKTAGSDLRLCKATWPSTFGVQRALERCDELLAEAEQRLQGFGDAAEPLRWMGRFIVDRDR